MGATILGVPIIRIIVFGGGGPTSSAQGASRPSVRRRTRLALVEASLPLLQRSATMQQTFRLFCALLVSRKGYGEAS